MEAFTVAVATFGHDSWQKRAENCAVASVNGQAPVVQIHSDTLQNARNLCLALVKTEYVIYLDADDELEPGYVAAMATGSADVRAPRVRQMLNGWEQRKGFYMPRVVGHNHTCTGHCLIEGNWIVVGAAARTELLREVGGWDDYDIYEDWALWLKCHRAGASFEPVLEAVYRQNVSRDSRNRSGPAFDHRHYWHQRIGHDIWPEAYDDPDHLLPVA